MKERPILFSTPMVQAILAGRKTQTRRVVKDDLLQNNQNQSDEEFLLITMGKCPYGKVGDVLWVRETFRPKSHSFPIGEPFEYKATAEVDGNPIDEPWKPSIFMPKDAARIWLRITNVRVERLQDISEEDAKAEGIYGEQGSVSKITLYRKFISATEARIKGLFTESAKECFQTLWQSINGEGSWNDNPWVWVIEFERIE